MTREAFEHIAQELRPRLLGIGRRFFHKEETAEDIAQETLMRLWMVREHRQQLATVRQQGWKPNVEFFSPQYTDPAQKTRPDHRTTLYWTPKVKTDEEGRATVRFYASDISRRYLVTLEGVSDDGIIIQKQTIIE